MDNKHTPGPWTIYDGNDKELAIVGEGAAVAFIPPQHRKVVENSHLIAAAPDMIKVLQDLISDSSKGGIHRNLILKEAQEIVKKALNKQ